MSDFAKVSEVKAGTKLKTDGGFTCIGEGAVVTVEDTASDENGHQPGDRLYFSCAKGKHFLNGQLDDEDQHYVGLYLVEQQS